MEFIDKVLSIVIEFELTDSTLEKKLVRAALEMVKVQIQMYNCTPSTSTPDTGVPKQNRKGGSR